MQYITSVLASVRYLQNTPEWANIVVYIKKNWENILKGKIYYRSIFGEKQ